jgi:hypothetical protein
MKTQIILASLLVAGCICARGQITLHAGDSYTYQFSSFQFLGTAVPGAPLLTGNAFAVFDGATFQSGDSTRLALFETGLADVPFAMNTIVDVPLPTAYGPGLGATGFGWHDLQGVVQVTQLGGSATLQQIVLRYYDQPTGGPINVYGATIVPVPEPGLFSLLLFGAAAGCACWWRNRK